MAEQQERARHGLGQELTRKKFAAEVAAADAQRRPTPARELWDSLLLLGLTVSSLGIYVGLAFVAARLFSAR